MRKIYQNKIVKSIKIKLKTKSQQNQIEIVATGFNKFFFI